MSIKLLCQHPNLLPSQCLGLASSQDVKEGRVQKGFCPGGGGRPTWGGCTDVMGRGEGPRAQRGTGSGHEGSQRMEAA